MITEDCEELVVFHEKIDYTHTLWPTINHIPYANYQIPVIQINFETSFTKLS